MHVLSLLISFLVIDNGLATRKTYTVDKDWVERNPGQSSRNGEKITTLVFHCSAPNFQDARALLTGGEVSVHYLIPRETVDGDPNNSGKWKIYQLVDESMKAWHAGKSYWQGKENVNPRSIGIEVVNSGTESFPEKQIAATISLVKHIVKKYKIIATRVVGHNDIATPPNRKLGPGVHFPWRTFYENGIGAWPQEADIEEARQQLNGRIPSRAWLQEKLSTYGYFVDASQGDQALQKSITLFQKHFRSSNIDGVADVETISILMALIKRYFPNQYQFE